jgi:anti-sigma regulatory factor (Ser/Thr protein kinase)
MRRNSENLLVLSGQDSAREDAGAVSADEIIGAALSEVEHYQRIELGPAPQVAVRGEAVNDLVHVVSELLENATSYSGNTTVTVASAETHDGDWQIEIIDHGAGMPQAEIDRTNARLAHPPDVDVEVSRRMGLFVVATLATRHRIDVSLSSGQDGGLIATVLVPSALIVELPPMPGPPPPAEPAAAPEPELLAPLAPLTPPEPEPEPEPEELTPPSIEAGPLRRAPVVARDHSPQWPTADDDSHLDLDAPTERMPAYRDVLSRWFDASAAPAAPATGPEAPRQPVEPRPVAEEPRPVRPEPRHALAAAPPPPPPPPPPVIAPVAAEPNPDDEDTDPQFAPVAPPAAIEPDYQWPTPAELEQEDGAEDTWPFLKAADSAASPGAVPEQRPILSLSPEAVRERMTSLQGGFRRGRHARGDDTRNQ